MKRKMIYAVLLAMSVLALTGCKKKDEPAVQPETQEQTANGLMKNWHGRDRLQS